MEEKRHNIHEGHRKRLKQRFLREGLDGFDPVNLLELLLFFGVQRGDTNETAHRLLEQFGSLERVMEAPYEELLRVKGVGENCAVLLKFIHAFGYTYEIRRAKAPILARGVDELAAYLMPYFAKQKVETLYQISLDGKGKILGCDRISEGSVDATQLNPRKIVELALRYNATHVFLAHNHPSNVALPSVQDLQATREMERTLASLSVTLIDHIILSDDGDYVSLTQSGFIGRTRTDAAPKVAQPPLRRVTEEQHE